MGEKHLPEVTAHQAPSPAVSKHMECIAVGEKYILRISPASFQIHSTQDYYRCHEKWAFAFPAPPQPPLCPRRGQNQVQGCGSQNRPLLGAAEGAWDLNSPGPKVWLPLCFPLCVCAGWDLSENEKYLLSPIPQSISLPCIVSF